MGSTESMTSTERGHGIRSRYILWFGVLIYLICLVGLNQLSQTPWRGESAASVDGHLVVEDGIYSDASLILHPGDRIESVDGHVVKDPIVLEMVLNAHAIGDTVPFAVVRNGEHLMLGVPLVQAYSTVYMIIGTLIATLCWALGLLAALKQPRSISALVFCIAMNCTAVMIMATSGRYTYAPMGLGHALQIVFILAYVFTPALFIHFTFLFPRRKQAPRGFLPALYAAAILIGLVTGTAFILGTVPSIRLDVLQVFSFGFNACRMLYVAGSLFAVGSFVHSYRSTRDEIERRKLRLTLLGASVGPLGFILLWLVPAILHTVPLVSEEVMILVSGITPITFAIAIVRHRLMDVDFILGRSTVYAIVLGVLMTLYGAIVGVAATLISDIQIYAAVVVALLFEPLRVRVQKFVDRRFFRVRYNFRIAQRELTDKINYVVDQKQLGEIVVADIDELLCVEKIGFVMVNSDTGHMTILAHRNFTRERWKSIALDSIMLGGKEEKLITLDELIEQGIEHIKLDREIYTRYGIALIQSVATADPNLLAVLVLGRKKSESRFSAEDIDLINNATVQAGAAIERITLQKDLVLEQAESGRLKELNRLKSFFVSSVSHELKTPLTSIRIFAEMLQSDELLPLEQVSRYAHTIESESNRLTRLIDNVLDFSKVERGVKEYQFRHVDLNSVVREILDSMSYQISLSGFALETDLSARDLDLHADPDALAGVIVNLVSNAMKYSSARKEIAVRTYRENGYAALAVSDSGIGISTDDQRRIFEPFYRSLDNAAASVAGTGLGLALVRHMAEAHGGSIGVESQPRKGSTFTLLFPAMDNNHTLPATEDHENDSTH